MRLAGVLLAALALAGCSAAPRRSVTVHAMRDRAPRPPFSAPESVRGWPDGFVLVECEREADGGWFYGETYLEARERP